jgi:hypothetical protein
VKIRLPAVEPHINAIVTAIFGEPGVKRLMDVADQMSDKPQCNALLTPWRICRLEHLHITTQSPL